MNFGRAQHSTLTGAYTSCTAENTNAQHTACYLQLTADFIIFVLDTGIPIRSLQVYCQEMERIQCTRNAYLGVFAVTVDTEHLSGRRVG